MNSKDIMVIAATLVAGAVFNYLYAVLAKIFSIPVRIEFVIIAYCLLIMVLSLHVAEVVGIGIISGILTIIATPSHSITVSGGQVTIAGGLGMALFNLVSEPVGIIACFLAYAYLAKTISTGAQFLTAFLATIASGLVYLLLVSTFNPGLIATTPAWTGDFLLQVIQVAVVNALLVQVLFMIFSKPVQAALRGNTG